MAVWFLLGGLFLVLLEVFSPGYFIGVPGGTLVLMGLMGLGAPHVMFGSLGFVLWPAAAVVATLANLYAYRKWAPPGDSPDTLAGDSLPGKAGVVTSDVHAGSLDGKVLIQGSSWSARVEDGQPTITTGAKVRVVRSEGVHVIVEKA
jgi:membrane protein implicated in regulation of membrane protease activity